MAVNQENKSNLALLPTDALIQIQKMLSEIHYGSIEIIIHENRIAHIERKEKIRIKNR